jgi:uncharacterized protein YcbK (DUF882 family)
MKYLSKNFKDIEFKCKCCGQFISNDALIWFLECIREHFKQPITIVSGTRCVRHNKECGGAENSQHLYGRAVDIQIKGVSPDSVYKYCDSININGGVGKYKTFTHIDVRNFKSRW